MPAAIPDPDLRKCLIHLCNILKNFNYMRINDELCDVTIKVEEVSFKAHKAILKACSPYFNAMFTGNLKENINCEVILHKTSATAVKAILDYFYTLHITVNETNVENLLSTACLFQLDEVQQMCVDCLIKLINENNCLGIKAFAHLYMCNNLYDEAKRYSERYFKKVVLTEEFLLLPLDQLIELISSNTLLTTEERVYEAAIKWIRYDLVKRQTHSYDVLQHIRFENLAPAYIVKISTTEELIKDSLPCRNLLDIAKNHLLLKKIEIDASKVSQSANKIKGGTAPKDILYAVGHPQNLVSSKIYAYNGHNWSICSPMRVRRAHMGIAVVMGYVYVIGGYNQTLFFNSMERYTPKTKLWEDMEPAFTKRSNFGIAINPLTNLIYVIGGRNKYALNVLECYSPLLNQWTKLPSMKISRYDVAVTILNNILYVLGGKNGLKSVEAYNIKTNHWEDRCDMLIGRHNFSVLTHQNYLFAIGGDVKLSIERYNVSTDTWTLLQTCWNLSHIAVASNINDHPFLLAPVDKNNIISFNMQWKNLVSNDTVIPSITPNNQS